MLKTTRTIASSPALGIGPQCPPIVQDRRRVLALASQIVMVRTQTCVNPGIASDRLSHYSTP